jgi:hypothetical protein
MSFFARLQDGEDSSMLLKIRRSQREGGLISKNVIFCLDARADFTAQEQQNITRYKLHNQMIYNSEASARHLAKADAQRDGSLGGSLKSLALVAMAAMKLNISIASLQRGQHVECKSLDELLGAEQAIMTACENLKGYLDTAATFDGREVLVDFATGAPQVVAHAAAPALIVPPPAPPLPAPAPALPAPAVEGAEAIPEAASATPPAAEPAQYVAEGMSSETKLALIVAGIFLLVILLYSAGRH